MNGEGSAGWMWRCVGRAGVPVRRDGRVGRLDGRPGRRGRHRRPRAGHGARRTTRDVPRHVVLECGDTSDAGSRVLLWVDGDQVADVPIDDPRGPYQKAAAVAGSAASMSMVFNARFDDVVVRTGARDAPWR
ncbi:MAG: hypothetical protein R3C32_10560 [Chloroflexota bacterium]